MTNPVRPRPSWLAVVGAVAVLIATAPTRSNVWPPLDACQPSAVRVTAVVLQYLLKESFMMDDDCQSFTWALSRIANHWNN